MRLYPFIDIAVLPQVRESFSKGDALAVLSEDAGEVLWVNGPGAMFFGSEAIEDWIGESTPLQPQARRQLRAAAGSASPRPLLLRMDRGVTQRQIAVKASRIDLPDGSQGILMIAPGKGEAHALSGFSDDKAVAALLDETGAQIVGDPRLAEIDPSPEDLLVMRGRLDREGTASVKQRIHTARGLIPAALGNLDGKPQRFLLFMFLEPVASEAPAETQPAATEPSTLRFLWETDADGRFAIVSETFKRVVGVTAAVEERAFDDVMLELGLDPDKRLSSLMKRRETWSGRTVSWPIAGTDTAIPTDLAALPLFDRDRRFLGYRGYGVAHLPDIAPDPDRRGLAFADGWPEEENQPDMAKDGTASSAPTDTETQKSSASDVLFEPPALTPSPLRRRSDSPVGRGPRKTLTDAETLAFQSIGARLREDNDAAEPALPALSDNQYSAPHESDPAHEPAAVAETEPADDLSLPADASTAEFVEAESDPVPPSTVYDESTGLDDETARLAIETMGWKRSNKIAPALMARLAARPGRDSQAGDESARTEDDAAGDTVLGDPVEAEAEDSETTDIAEMPDDEAADADPILTDERAVEATSVMPEESVEPELADVEPLAVESPSESGEASSEDADDGPDHPAANSGNDVPVDASSEIAGEGNKTDDTAETGDRAAETTAPPLSRSTRLTPAALAFLPVASLVLDHGRIAYASRSLLDLTGYQDVAALEHAGGFAALFGEPEPAGEERPDGPPLRIAKADGSVADIHAQMQAIGWNGATALLFAFAPTEASDEATAQSPAVTEAADEAKAGAALLSEEEAMGRAEELAEPLRRHVDELTAILDTATDGVIILTPEGDIRSVNRSGEALFGEDAEALRERPFRQLFAYESRLTIDSYLASLRESGMASVLNDGREVIGKEKSGGFIPLFITLGKLPFDSGYCVVLRDITPWKRVENELRQARRAAEDASAQKTEFLARVSHEVRTPLNAIIGFSELMISERFGPVGNPRYRDYLRDIQKSGNHVLDLVNDLLDISKIEGGHQEMEYEAVGLNEVVAEAVAMLQPQANAERVIIRTSLHSGLPDVVADPRSIKQVAINLLTNAVKFTAAGGQVIVSTGKNREGAVSLRFRDSGIGMSDEDISQALKPFKQISTLRRSRRDGTGLGLPLTKALVEANKARFSIESEPNIGTLVEVTFPSGRVLN